MTWSRLGLTFLYSNTELELLDSRLHFGEAFLLQQLFSLPPSRSSCRLSETARRMGCIGSSQAKKEGESTRSSLSLSLWRSACSLPVAISLFQSVQSRRRCVTVGENQIECQQTLGGFLHFNFSLPSLFEGTSIFNSASDGLAFLFLVPSLIAHLVSYS